MPGPDPYNTFLGNIFGNWTPTNLTLWISDGALGGAYLASPQNLLLREPVDIRFGAMRGPIRTILASPVEWFRGEQPRLKQCSGYKIDMAINIH